MYDSSLKAKWDYENSIAFAGEIALEKGIGLGIEKGIKKGGHQKALDIARLMKRHGLPIAQITEFTGLSIDEIEKL